MGVQLVTEELITERLAQIDQWGEAHVPPPPSVPEGQVWSRDDLVQLGATVIAQIQRLDRERRDSLADALEAVQARRDQVADGG
jgi:hypothetical protein